MRALQAAKRFRDEVETQASHWTTTELANSPSSRNASGTVGVRKVRQSLVRDGVESRYWFWVAQWTDGHGHRKTRSFSVRKYGEDDAHAMAIAARKEGVRKSGR